MLFNNCNLAKQLLDVCVCVWDEEGEGGSVDGYKYCENYAQININNARCEPSAIVAKNVV